MHDRRDLARGYAVQGVDVNQPGRVTPIENLHAPRHRGLAAVQLLVEIVAQTPDRLRQHDTRGDRVAEGRQRNSPAAACDPSPNTAERDGTPDSEAPLPDPKRRTKTGAPRTEIGFPVGHHVIEPASDETERHRPYRDVVDDTALTTAGRPPAITDQQRGDDARDDAQRVCPDWHGSEVPHALRGTREVGKHRCRHVVGTSFRTPTANSSVSARTAGTPSPRAETRAEPTITPSA